MTPDWTPPPLPWERPPTTQATPLADEWRADDWRTPAGAVPDEPDAAPARGRTKKKLEARIVAFVVALALVAGFVAAGGRIPTHGERPTEGAAVTAPTTVPAPLPAGPAGSSTIGGLGPDEVAAVAAEVRTGVVLVNTVVDFGRGSGAGTGIILTSTGQILTNNHVVENASRIRVTVVKSGKVYDAKVIGTAPVEDLALLKIDASGLDAVNIGDSGGVTPGDGVVAIGNAGGRGGEPAVVSGIVQATNVTITASEDASGAGSQVLHGLIETDAPIEPGDSGGPLIDADGNVIGVNSAASVSGRFSRGTTAGFAIPIARAMEIVKLIRSGVDDNTVNQGLPGFLGVELPRAADVTDGVLVSGVTSGGAADDAGIQAGDTITAIGGDVVHTSDQLSAAIRSHRAGERVTIRWTDTGGNGHTAKVTLDEGPAD